VKAQQNHRQIVYYFCVFLRFSGKEFKYQNVRKSFGSNEGLSLNVVLMPQQAAKLCSGNTEKSQNT